jgi:hypothetical protein
MDDETLRMDTFVKYREECLKRNLSNSENFDRSVLTLSIAALALSVTFLTKLPGEVTSPFAMLLSWALFAIAVLSTLGSFLTSQKALEKSIEQAERYYIHCDATAIYEKSRWLRVNAYLTYISGAAFSSGIIALLCFVSQNLG